VPETGAKLLLPSSVVTVRPVPTFGLRNLGWGWVMLMLSPLSTPSMRKLLAESATAVVPS
jgi:hypothetical protein